MIYYYHCYRGAHLSSVAAALHLEILKPSAAVADILRLEYFDVLQNRDMGVPVLAGYAQGSAICFLGIGPGSKIFPRFARSMTEGGEARFCYKSVDCLQAINLPTRIGGFMSRYKRLRSLGRYIAARGIHKNLAKIYSLVLQAKES